MANLTYETCVKYVVGDKIKVRAKALKSATRMYHNGVGLAGLTGVVVGVTEFPDAYDTVWVSFDSEHPRALEAPMLILVKKAEPMS